MGEPLKSCPFCGGEAKVFAIRDGRAAHCVECGAEGPPAYRGRPERPSTEERAVAAWNRRAAPSPDPEAGPSEFWGTVRRASEAVAGMDPVQRSGWDAVVARRKVHTDPEAVAKAREALIAARAVVQSEGDVVRDSYKMIDGSLSREGLDHLAPLANVLAKIDEALAALEGR